ncbi:MAG: NUDIX domain-containing protein [Deltaproteobacteria bacterium]|nr:NUDIX domain-containing protein [Deltaproteobacteria bacterium]
MKKETVSCGVLLFQDGGRPAFLVLYRKDGSPDLPKGRREKGETDEQAAMRELVEETGIPANRVRLTAGFVYENTYPTRAKKSGEGVQKTVRVFHGVVAGPVVVDVSDHADYAWVPVLEPLRGHDHTFRDNPTILGALRAWDLFRHEEEERP